MRKRNGDGGETAIVICRDVEPDPKIRAECPAAKKLASSGETLASKASLERR